MSKREGRSPFQLRPFISLFHLNSLCLAGPCASRSLSLFVLIQLNCLFALLFHTLCVIYLGDFYNVGKCDALCFWAMLEFSSLLSFRISISHSMHFRFLDSILIKLPNGQINDIVAVFQDDKSKCFKSKVKCPCLFLH
jgi:hypothetical protein